MEAFSKPTVEALHRKILAVASQPLVEFNHYKVLELLHSLCETDHDLKHEKYPYYHVVYHMLSEKVHDSTAYFREVLLSLLGDKEQEKVMERVSNGGGIPRIPDWRNDGALLHQIDRSVFVSIVADQVIFKRSVLRKNEMTSSVSVTYKLVPLHLRTLIKLCSDHVGYNQVEN